MDRFHEAYHYIKHLLLAKKRHGVHSPLVYHLSDHVLDSSRFFAVFEDLDKISNEEPEIFHFSEKAQMLADDWRRELEQENHKKDLHPVLRGHFSKYRSAILQIAMLSVSSTSESCRDVLRTNTARRLKTVGAT